MEEPKQEKTMIALCLTEDERQALRERLKKAGKKQYFYVRELVIDDLVRENYLPQPQS